MHYRTRLRRAVRRALETASALADYRILPSAGIRVDAGDLPVLGLATERTDHAGAAAGAAQDSVVELAVLAKRAGGDEIEDALDQDSASIEAVVLPVLAGESDSYGLSATELAVDGEGASRIGTLQMTFRVLYRAPEGNPNS